jgi:EF hand
MLTNLAALGVGLITAVATPAAAHGWDGNRPDAPHPSHGAPAPMYAPTRAHAPSPSAHRVGSRDAAALRRADYNRDGGVTFAEAHAYARSAFGRADTDHNGALTRRELRNAPVGLERDARSPDRITLADYDASVRADFRSLDRNRDGFLSGYELGTSVPSRQTVSYSWHWQL